MKAVSKYKAIVEKVGRMMMVFANTNNVSTFAKYWTLANIHKAQVDVMNYANTAADQIKSELIGDGDEAKFRGRLKTAFFELGADPNFAPSYFPVFDEALFELPSKDEPDKNRQMLDALTDVYGGDAADVMVSLQATTQWANFMVQDMAKMLDEVCKFVGYTPERQEQPEPQPRGQEQQNEQGKEIPTLKNTDKERLVFGNALMKQYMSLDKDKYKWHKPYNLLAYMCGRLYCGDRVIDIDGTEELKKGNRQMPRTAVKELFSGIDVANNRYSMKEPPTDYWIIDDLFKDKGGVSR